MPKDYTMSTKSDEPYNQIIRDVLRELEGSSEQYTGKQRVLNIHNF